ncbi:Suppressor Mra1 family protein [Pyrolobus fumarii 1A]|uniref:Ribosomal RNA small subunit methyltransferase Nep1 n=1 Tax=Pyrolobus fumarii (strain DSM 11204 / 1A) TaxID=694429 RepID=G0EFD8_PYRF1|nr:Suppressor Mra1 family protein [Pyrolobus fumarii 1A]
MEAAARRVRIVLLESPLELVPREIRNHPQVVRYARRFGIDPGEALLDKTYHYYAMASLPQKWKRGRPDIVHVSLLLLQDSVLNLTGHLEVYIHVLDGRVFRVEPETRIPKHLDRFKGLMAQLLIHNRVPPTGKPLIHLYASTLREFVDKMGGLILLWERGKPATPADIVREALETGWPIGIGMFPRGDFKKSTLRKASRTYSIYGGVPLKAWTVIHELLCAAEEITGARRACCPIREEDESENAE